MKLLLSCFILCICLLISQQHDFDQDLAIGLWNLNLLSYCHGSKIRSNDEEGSKWNPFGKKIPSLLKYDKTPYINDITVVESQAIPGQSVDTHTRVLIMLSKKEKKLFVVCRGSDVLNLRNWMSNLLPGFSPIGFDGKEAAQLNPSAMSQPVQENNMKEEDTSTDSNIHQCDGCKIHGGFHLTFNTVKDKVINALNEYCKYIKDNKKRVSCQKSNLKNYQVIVTGHSLGGAMTTFASYAVHDWLRSLGFSDDKILKKKLLIYSFGSPRVGNREFAAHYNYKFPSNSFRIVHKKDPVSYVPWDGIKIVKNGQTVDSIQYFHVGTEIWYNQGTSADNQLIKTLNNLASGTLGFFSFIPFSQIIKVLFAFKPKIPGHVTCPPIFQNRNQPFIRFEDKISRNCYQGFLNSQGYTVPKMLLHLLDHLTYFGRSIVTDVSMDNTCGLSFRKSGNAPFSFITDLVKLAKAFKKTLQDGTFDGQKLSLHEFDEDTVNGLVDLYDRFIKSRRLRRNIKSQSKKL